MRSARLLSVLMLGFLPAHAAEKDDRGLLPDIRMDAASETENEKRALQTELLITKAETKAIESLQKIIQRKKGTPEEAELDHRLAEMYMRRARTGRFFDLNKNSKTLQLSTFPIPPERGLDWIRKASTVYTDIEKRFPKYIELDSVLFNNAFAQQQLGKIKDAEALYQRLIDNHPQSKLVPDAAVALGELSFDQRRFALALDHFARVEKYPDSRVYTYALYKSAWAYYNMKDSDRGVEKLLQVVKVCPPDASGDDVRTRQNLRREALRDLAIFVGDSKSASDLYAFFKKITTEDELGQSMMDLAKLSLTHGKHKEMNVFLDEFIKNNPRNLFRVKASLTLVDANENLKARDRVLAVLRDVGEQCRPGAGWREAQTADTAKESCHDAFSAKSREIAAKWWEIWQKNKAHQEFSNLTEQALKIVLENEDPQKPDTATRFGYAELLFQLNRFEEASEQYARTSLAIAPTEAPKGPAKTMSAEETQRLHNADYGALYSVEKAIEIKKTTLLEAKRKDFAQTYLRHFPKADHAGEVTLRMGVILYEEQDLDGSRKWIDPLLAGHFGRELQRKAEDLDLDILNLKKDYKALSTHADAYLKTEKDEARRASLRKIELESSYAGLQQSLKSSPTAEATKSLKAFAAAHEKTPLAAEALLQAAALDFVDGRGLSGADAIEALATQAPTHAKLDDGLKDAARAAAEAGQMMRAANLLQKLADRDPKGRAAHLEAAADFEAMENRPVDARRIYNLLLPTAPKDDRPRLYTKILDTFNGDADSAEAKRLESLVLSQNLEPFATKILTKRARAMYEAGQSSQAFEAARKIMSREAPAEMRAEARLIQARILEDEFKRQSVKSSKEERLGLVLSMKTEKLEKAQTAYLSASKMTADAKILIEAFSGIDRCYANFVDALEHLQPPASLSDADQKALREEIARLVTPFREKRDDNRKEIKKLAAAAVDTKATKWDDLAGESSPMPMVPARWTFLKPFVPVDWNDDPTKITRADFKKPACDAKKPDFAKCFLSGHLDEAETVARAYTQDKATRVRGWHHLALVAEARGLGVKALWLLKLAERENLAHPLVSYEKGRMLSKIEGNTASSADFAKVLDTKISSTEIGILRGFKAFSEGDSEGVKRIFSGFSVRELYDLNVGPMLSEALAQLGDTEKALKLISDLAAIGKNPDLLIQKARLAEVYKFAPVEALQAYAEAAKLTTDSAQKDWLVRKTEYLKVNFKVGLNVTSGD